MTRLVVQIEHPYKDTGSFQIEFQDEKAPYVSFLNTSEFASDCSVHIADHHHFEMLRTRLRATFPEMVCIAGEDIKFGEHMWSSFVVHMARYVTVLLTEARREQPPTMSL